MKQHIKESHKHLLEETSIDDLVLQIKLHTQEAIEEKIGSDYNETFKNKVKCPHCGIYYGKGFKLKSHLKHVHKIDDNYQENKDQGIAIKNILKERKISNMACWLLEYKKYLLKWDGKSLDKKTADRYFNLLLQLYDDMSISQPFEILSEENCNQIAEYIENKSQTNRCGTATIITSLKHLGSFMTARKRRDIAEQELEFHLAMFNERMKGLGESYERKVKKKIRSERKEKLDIELLTLDQVQFLHNHCKYLIEESIKSNDLKLSMLAIGCAFSFLDGNASRPDVATNATISEYKKWRMNPDSEFHVYEHKTNHQYGPVRLCTESIKDLLIKYGDEQIKSKKDSDKLLSFTTGGFSKSWQSQRKRFPIIRDLTNTSYRKFIETYSRMHLNPDEQEIISERLVHRSDVAKQSYMATPKLKSVSAQQKVVSLLEKIAHKEPIEMLTSYDGIQTNITQVPIMNFCFYK